MLDKFYLTFRGAFFMQKMEVENGNEIKIRWLLQGSINSEKETRAIKAKICTQQAEGNEETGGITWQRQQQKCSQQKR